MPFEEVLDSSRRLRSVWDLLGHAHPGQALRAARELGAELADEGEPLLQSLQCSAREVEVCALVDLDRLDEAEQRAEEGIRLALASDDMGLGMGPSTFGSSFSAELCRARVWEAQGRITDALQSYEGPLRERSVRSYGLRLACYVKLGRPETWRPFLARWKQRQNPLSKSSPGWEAHLAKWLALGAMENGDSDSAKALLENACNLGRSPARTELITRFALAHWYAVSGERKLALDAFEEAANPAATAGLRLHVRLAWSALEHHVR